jgi:hypothetical protein
MAQQLRSCPSRHTTEAIAEGVDCVTPSPATIGTRWERRVADIDAVARTKMSHGAKLLSSGAFLGLPGAMPAAKTDDADAPENGRAAAVCSTTTRASAQNPSPARGRRKPENAGLQKRQRDALSTPLGGAISYGVQAPFRYRP